MERMTPMARSSTTFGKGDKSASDAGKASTSCPFRSKSGGNFKNDWAAAKDASDAGHQRRWHGNKD
jgi:hypothetical protein